MMQRMETPVFPQAIFYTRSTRIATAERKTRPRIHKIKSLDIVPADKHETLTHKQQYQRVIALGADVVYVLATATHQALSEPDNLEAQARLRDLVNGLSRVSDDDSSINALGYNMAKKMSDMPNLSLVQLAISAMLKADFVVSNISFADKTLSAEALGRDIVPAEENTIDIEALERDQKFALGFTKKHSNVFPAVTKTRIKPGDKKEHLFDETRSELVHDLLNGFTTIRGNIDLFAMRLHKANGELSQEVYESFVGVLSHSVGNLHSFAQEMPAMLISEYRKEKATVKDALAHLVDNLVVAAGVAIPPIVVNEAPKIAQVPQYTETHVNVPKVLFNRLASNVIQNIRRYVQHPTPEITVATRFTHTRRTRQYIECIVRDNGLGFPEEIAQSGKFPKKSLGKKGQGLGMAGVQGAFKHLGINLVAFNFVDEQTGQTGAAVRFKLPIVQQVS